MSEAARFENQILHPEVLDWFTCFCKTVNTKDPVKIICMFVQMGVDDPENCVCELGVTLKPGSVSEWIHSNHRLVNLIFWRAITHYGSLVPSLRAVLEKDLTTLWQTEEEDRKALIKFFGEVPEGYVFDPCGNILSHCWCRKYLDNFVIADKAKVKWL